MSHLLLFTDTRWLVTATKVALSVVGCYTLFWMWERHGFQNTDFFFLPPAEDQLWPQQISTDSFKNRTLFHFSRMVLVWSYLKGGEWTRWPFKIFSILWYRGFMNSAHLIIWPSFTYAFIFPGQTSIQNFIQTANTIPLGSYLLLSIHTH